MKIRPKFLATPARLFTVAALSVVLVACGGGSGDGDDGSVDAGGEGDVPVIGGGVDSGMDPDPINPDPPVVDGGSPDGCEGGSGTDLDSSTPNWDDNCRLQVNGEHANSRYAQGVQRIIFCRGHNGGGTDLAAFADGLYGPNTEEQVRAFQTAQNIGVDGVVGPETWGELQLVLELLDNVAPERDSHGVLGADCDGQIMFYQTRELSGALTGWTMAATPGNPETLPFSVDPAR